MDRSTWYCAQISRIERQWIEVNYYTTVTPALGNYDVAGKQRRISRLEEATFLRTWVLKNSGGFPTTTAPKNDRDRVEQLWRGRIPIEHIDDHMIIRDIGLNARQVRSHHAGDCLGIGHPTPLWSLAHEHWIS
jgi:hypothetical protein